MAGVILTQKPWFPAVPTIVVGSDGWDAGRTSLIVAGLGAAPFKWIRSLILLAIWVVSWSALLSAATVFTNCLGRPRPLQCLFRLAHPLANGRPRAPVATGRRNVG